jgi:hypothetical protein
VRRAPAPILVTVVPRPPRTALEDTVAVYSVAHPSPSLIRVFGVACSSMPAARALFSSSLPRFQSSRSTGRFAAAFPFQASHHGLFSFALCARRMATMSLLAAPFFLPLQHPGGLLAWRTLKSSRLSFATRTWTTMVASVALRRSISSELLICLSPRLRRCVTVPNSVPHLVRFFLISSTAFWCHLSHTYATGRSELISWTVVKRATAGCNRLLHAIVVCTRRGRTQKQCRTGCPLFSTLKCLACNGVVAMKT